MIVGKRDTYYSVAEFAQMIGRSPRTIENWASEGRIKFNRIFGVPMISLRAIEDILEERNDQPRPDEALARNLMGHR